MSAPRLPPRPCTTCPYRRDTPPGLWHEEEYQKLTEYDREAPMPALTTFHCHQELVTGVPTLCRGWVSCHGFDSVAVRLAVAHGVLTVEQVEAPCSVPLYDSGKEACAAGMSGVEQPGPKAILAMHKLESRRINRLQKKGRA